MGNPALEIRQEIERRGGDEGPPKRRVDPATKRLLDARKPLVLAAIDLGESVWAMVFDPNRDRNELTTAIVQVDAALAELRQALMHAPGPL